MAYQFDRVRVVIELFHQLGKIVTQRYGTMLIFLRFSKDVESGADAAFQTYPLLLITPSLEQLATVHRLSH